MLASKGCALGVRLGLTQTLQLRAIFLPGKPAQPSPAEPLDLSPSQLSPSSQQPAAWPPSGPGLILGLGGGERRGGEALQWVLLGRGRRRGGQGWRWCLPRPSWGVRRGWER